MRRLIVDLCAWQPLTARELAQLLNRKPRYLKRRYLNPMIKKGLLQYEVPDKPRSPDQAYRSI